MSIIVVSINTLNIAIKNIHCQTEYQTTFCFREIHLKFKNTKRLKVKKKRVLQFKP